MNGRPKVEIGIFIINDSKSKILLGKNKFDPFWKLLTGRLKYSEDFDESAHKHLIEQIDLKIDKERINFLSSFNAIDREKNFHTIEIDFYVILTQTEEKNICNDIRNVYQGWQWFSFDDIQMKKQEIFCGIINLFKKNLITSIEQIMTISSN